MIYSDSDDEENSGEEFKPDKQMMQEKDDDFNPKDTHIPDIDDINSIGNMLFQKQEGTIRISGCAPNGINTSNLKSQLQQSMDLDIDLQCYSEVNTNFLNAKICRQFHEKSKAMDPHIRCTWSTSDITSPSDYKPGGTGIVNRGALSKRVTESGYDQLG